MLKVTLLQRIEKRKVNFLNVSLGSVRAVNELLDEGLLIITVYQELELSLDGKRWLHNYKEELRLNGEGAAKAWAVSNGGRLRS